MLGEHVQRQARRRPSPPRGPPARYRARRRTRPVPGHGWGRRGRGRLRPGGGARDRRFAAGATGLRGCQLDDLVDGREIHAEVEARGRHHAAHAAVAQACSAAWRSAGSDRTVVQRQRGRIVQPHRHGALCPGSACERVLANSGVLRTPANRATTRCNWDRPGGRPGKAIRRRRAAGCRGSANAAGGIQDRRIRGMQQQHVARLGEVAQRRR